MPATIMPMPQLMMVAVNMQWKIMTVTATVRQVKTVTVNVVAQLKLMNVVYVVVTVLM